MGKFLSSLTKRTILLISVIEASLRRSYPTENWIGYRWFSLRNSICCVIEEWQLLVFNKGGGNRRRYSIQWKMSGSCVSRDSISINQKRRPRIEKKVGDLSDSRVQRHLSGRVITCCDRGCTSLFLTTFLSPSTRCTPACNKPTNPKVSANSRRKTHVTGLCLCDRDLNIFSDWIVQVE